MDTQIPKPIITDIIRSVHGWIDIIKIHMRMRVIILLYLYNHTIQQHFTKQYIWAITGISPRHNLRSCTEMENEKIKKKLVLLGFFL